MTPLSIARPLAALLLLGGCASAAQASPREPTAAEGPVALRVARPAEAATYRRTQSVFVDNGGDGQSLRLVARGALEVTPEEDARVAMTQRYDQALEVERGGESAPVDAATRGLDSMQVRLLVDSQSRVLEGPTLSGAPAAGRVAHIAMSVLHRLFHASFPDGPVSVGEEWSPEPYRIGRDATHYAEVAVTPVFTLLGLETDDEGRTFARIGWAVDVHVLPFEAMGVSIEGLGEIDGFSLVALDDGVSGRSELDLEIHIGPAGSTDVLPIFQTRAKYADRIERAELVRVEPRIGEAVTLEAEAQP